ncbi:uncharacterized protein LOC113351685 [Papaver somniferum]|uniref:uncharacterized protein LOC113351685 n=1 Tax=Papaver somniferum TaxID=3469 RepID=UPI000E6F51BB|nr:uncharacterized protein LOC113351685 [Papaver somniferum]
MGLRGLRTSLCKNLWKRIWKIRVPYRIQVFIWTASRNDLPSRTILHTRMPIHSVDCPRCTDPHESVMHALSKLSDEAQSFFVAILWSLWTSRNNFIFQNISENHTTVLARARVMLLTRKTSLNVSTTTSVSICDKWMSPSFGWIKCNTDGDFDDTSGENGAGYVMRDFSRKATFCASLVFEVHSAEEAEARAIWAVLKKALEQQLTHIIIESYAKSLIDQFSAGYFKGNSCTDAIFKDIQLFSSRLVVCIFSSQPRYCNFVAHELAMWAKKNNSTMYRSVPPVWLLPIVEEDHYPF